MAMPDVRGGFITSHTDGSTTVDCPVDGCEWVHTEPPEQQVPPGLAAVFGPGVIAGHVSDSRRRNLERALHNHFRTHGVDEWVCTITRLRMRLEAYDVGVGEAWTAQCAECGDTKPRLFTDPLSRGLWWSEHHQNTRHIPALSGEDGA